MSLDIDLIVKVKAVHYVEGELSDERYFEEVKCKLPTHAKRWDGL